MRTIRPRGSSAIPSRLRSTHSRMTTASRRGTRAWRTRVSRTMWRCSVGARSGISSDDPYFFPGQTVEQPNLMSQLEAAGLSWKGYFQGMPYEGYRGYCFPAKCNGIPDSDTQYVAKHNGVVNFANMQSGTEFGKMTPYAQLSRDLAKG